MFHDVSILLGREKLREGIPFDWRHLNLPVRGYPMCGYCLSCEDVDHEAAQIAASAARLAASATLLPRQLLLFLVLVLLQLGWCHERPGPTGTWLFEPIVWRLEVDPWIQNLKMFKASKSIFDDVSPAGISRGVDQGKEWWTPYASPCHPNLGYTWVITWVYPKVQVHIFRCM